MRGRQKLVKFALSGLCTLGWVTNGLALKVELLNGTTLDNVTIRRQDETTIQLETSFGVVNVPRAQIRSVDGEPLPPKPSQPEPATAPQPTPPVSPVAPSRLNPFHAPLSVHTYLMEMFLIAVALVSILWIAMLVWVQRDAVARFPDHPVLRRRWNAAVLLLPGLGLGGYLYARSRMPAPVADDSAKSAESTGRRGWLGGRKRDGPALPTRPPLEFLDENGSPVDIKRDIAEPTGLEAAHEVLQEAIHERASDVHIEPQDTECRVRFRVDGVLRERPAFGKQDGLKLVSAFKALSQIDVAEKRRAQDGRFRVRTGVHDIDLRVATASAIFGEKLVIRLLDRRGGRLGLDELGMSKPMLDALDRVIRSRSGILLATGPTGSGKTSTLYAVLGRLDARKLNVMTIEDPVEYQLDGATQIPVRAKAGVTFESGLRAILRQDPDVIFVGEIRDPETAKTAVRAALTGHLVLSTLHAQDALNTLLRLEELGVDKYQIHSALLLVVAQRLVRVLCPECRDPVQISAADWKELGMPDAPPDKLVYRARGCDACNQTGFLGRTAIFETLVLDDEMRRAFGSGITPAALADIARRKGFRTYREDGADKVLRGITSIDEVLQSG